ncbi:MAG: TetR/AcrR family transcriptional regulator [Promethearchaeota archaeon]
MMIKSDGRSKPRARSKEEKSKKFKKILEAGRDLFLSNGSRAFKIRKLANRAGMTEGNIYAYVTNKRDLWYAILLEDYKVFDDKIEHVINSHEGDFSSLIIKLAEFYLQFYREENERFTMMFLKEPPPPKYIKTKNGRENKFIGEYEKKLNTIRSLINLKRVVKEAADSGELNIKDHEEFTYLLWAFVHGVAYTSPDYIKNTGHPIIKYHQHAIERLKDFLGLVTSKNK